MSRKEPNNSIFEDVDSSKQTIRLVKDVPVDTDSKETKEVDVLADFKSESNRQKESKSTSKNIKVVEAINNDDDIPFEPTRELKIKRTNNYNESNEYKEKVLVKHSDDSVGVKKIIIGEETTTLPVYKHPKKDFKTTLRDIIIYLMMVAIVSTLVILLLKYCNREDKDTLLDISTSTRTTTKFTSAKPNTETTLTTTTMPGNTEATTTSTSKKPNLVMPTNPTSRPTKKPTTSSSTAKPTETQKTTEPTTTKPTPTEPTNPPEESDSPNDSEEQG